MVETVRKTYVDDKGNQIQISGKCMTQPMNFVDEYGNRLKCNLCSFSDSMDGKFAGYSVGPLNAGPDVEVVDDASAAQRDASYKKIYDAAEKYFNAHPEKRPDVRHGGRETTYIVEYTFLQLEEETRRRVASGKASLLEQAYVHQLDNPKSTQNFCWEQLVGKMPLDAPESVVQAAIEKDELTNALKKQEEEYKKSVERGTESIKKRVAEMQRAPSVIRNGNPERLEAERVVQKSTRKSPTMSEDEKNAVVQRKINELIRGR